MRGSLEERSGWKGCAQDRQCDISRIVPSRDLLVIEAGVGGAPVPTTPRGPAWPSRSWIAGPSSPRLRWAVSPGDPHRRRGRTGLGHRGRRHRARRASAGGGARSRRGLPRIQGAYLLLDGTTLTPLAVRDAVALTAVRTPAVSAVAVRHLARADARLGPTSRRHGRSTSDWWPGRPSWWSPVPRTGGRPVTSSWRAGAGPWTSATSPGTSRIWSLGGSRSPRDARGFSRASGWPGRILWSPWRFTSGACAEGQILSDPCRPHFRTIGPV